MEIQTQPMSIHRFANQFVCDLTAYEPGKPVEETARELGLRPEEVVKLASNENPLGPSPKAKRRCIPPLIRVNFILTGEDGNSGGLLPKSMGLK